MLPMFLIAIILFGFFCQRNTDIYAVEGYLWVLLMTLPIIREPCS